MPEETTTTDTVNSQTAAKETAAVPDHRQQVLLLASGLGMLAIFIFSYSTHERAIDPDLAAQTLIEEQSLYDASAFVNLSLEARAIFVYDVNNNKTIFARNEDVQLPLASLTKLMTAVVAVESLPYDAIVKIDAAALNQEGDSGLFIDEEWRAQDLLDFMLVASSNDSARALAGAAAALNQPPETPLLFHEQFIAAMNEKAKSLGLTQMYFLNETGLDTSDTISGGYGSAEDVAHLLSYALQTSPRSLDATSYPALALTSLTNIVHEAENTNEILGHIPGLIASKTGYTTLAGGNLVVAFDAGLGRPIIVSVLGSSRSGRFSDVEKLIRATYEAIQGEETL